MTLGPGDKAFFIGDRHQAAAVVDLEEFLPKGTVCAFTDGTVARIGVDAFSFVYPGFPDSHLAPTDRFIPLGGDPDALVKQDEELFA